MPGTAGEEARVSLVVHGHVPGRATSSRIRVAAALLLGAHLLTVGWLMLRPRTVPWVPPSNLQPFVTIQADLAAGPQAALIGIGGELLLLTPVGVLLPLAAGRLYGPRVATALRTVLMGVFLALGVAVLRSGAPSRPVTVDAMMLNAAGVALAHLLLYPSLRQRLLRLPAGPFTRDRDDRPRVGLAEEGTRGRTPRGSRVGIAP
ncbi:VanZ family protein [Streptomyces sp. RKND-216]|uniref:VanZ family protein n=1 Tax=Streptomyces sp. RKND-216 TaxID=2562581 RepID=UPI001FF85B01|nr:VanZ family protein [Streptomyces sp. RKND-216]